MATLTLKLDTYTLQKLTKAARKAGVPPEHLAAMMLEAWISPDDGLTRGLAGVSEPGHAWQGMAGDHGDDPQTTPSDYEGPFVDLDVALDEFSAAAITARAKSMNYTPEELATLELDRRLFDYDDFAWPEGGDPRAAVAEPIIEEELRDWTDVRPELEAYLQEKLKARR